MANTFNHPYGKCGAATVLAFALAGCAVGPDFRTPAVPAATGYMKNALPAEVGSAGAGGGTQPCAQVDHQLDGVEPVGLRAPLMALNRDARGIDHMTLDPASPQRAIDPERIRAGFVADDDTHIRRQNPRGLVPLDEVQHGLQPPRSVSLGHRCTNGRQRCPSCSATFHLAAASSSDTASTICSVTVVYAGSARMILSNRPGSTHIF